VLRGLNDMQLGAHEIDGEAIALEGLLLIAAEDEDAVHPCLACCCGRQAGMLALSTAARYQGICSPQPGPARLRIPVYAVCPRQAPDPFKHPL
jgi:hypothetical protein